VSTSVSISGSGKADVTVFGDGTVVAGNGDDMINITGMGQIAVGSGNDTLILGTGGSITEQGASGHDSIQIGSTGTYTIAEQGSATVTGAFGSATVVGGTLQIIENAGQTPQEIVTGGSVTIAGAASTAFGGHGTSGGTTGTTSHGHDTLVGGTGHDAMVSGHGQNLFESLRGNGDRNDQNFLKNFAAGQQHLLIEGNLQAFQAKANAVTTHEGKTMISMDSGKTMVELHGISHEPGKH
jgi:Ca2+-binding RTX toxin-like protein